jgi:hypothetical protein
VQSDGNGSVTGSGQYSAGQIVNITAMPNSGYTFDGWTPELCDNTFAMPDHDLTCTASAQKTVTVTDVNLCPPDTAHIKDFKGVPDGEYMLPSCPQETVADVIDISTVRQTAQAIFKGGVRVGNTFNLVKQATIKVEDLPQTIIAFKYNPVAEHIGSHAHLLAVYGVESPGPEKRYQGDSDTNYFGFGETIGDIYDVNLYVTAEEWPNQVANLMANPYLEDITLHQEEVAVFVPGDFTPLMEKLQRAGVEEVMIYFFIGYVLDDGTIVFNKNPISINVGGIIRQN